MEKQELVEYEVPTIAEFVSNDFLQNVIAKYTAWKVNRKWIRYQLRLGRKKFLESLTEKK